MGSAVPGETPSSSIELGKDPSPPPSDEPAWRSIRVRSGALLLAIASLQFFLAQAVEQALRPGYSDSTNTISDLGVNIEGWGYAWIFNTSIIALGLAAIVGVLLVYPVFPRRRLTTVGAGLVVLGAVGAIGVGVFTEQVAAFGTKAGTFHDLFSVWTFLFANVGLLVLGLGMFGRPVWGRYALLTTVLGVLSTVALGFYVENWLTKGNYFGLGEGGLERIVAFPVLVWAVLVGWIILSHRDAPAASPSSSATASAPGSS